MGDEMGARRISQAGLLAAVFLILASGAAPVQSGMDPVPSVAESSGEWEAGTDGEFDASAAAGCPSCDKGYQSLPSDGKVWDIVPWMKHAYPGAATSHLTQARGFGNEGFLDFHLVDDGNRIFFTKAAELKTRITRSLEQFHFDAEWVYIDFEWTDGTASAPTPWYREFTKRDLGPYVGKWALRGARTGEPFEIHSRFRNCPDTARHKFSATNTIRGPVHAPYTRCITDARSGATKSVKALVLESVSGKPGGLQFREWYWYGKSEDGTETYGLIRWDYYERIGPAEPWRLMAGGCQLNKIVGGDACIPWAVINVINQTRGCVTLGPATCP